jgi:hypothetical protein
MAFNTIMTLLFDPLIGGSPRAFECKLMKVTASKLPQSEEDRRQRKAIPIHVKTCGFVCRTLRGMRLHQKIVHAFIPRELP